MLEDFHEETPGKGFEKAMALALHDAGAEGGDVGVVDGLREVVGSGGGRDVEDEFEVEFEALAQPGFLGKHAVVSVKNEIFYVNASDHRLRVAGSW